MELLGVLGLFLLGLKLSAFFSGSETGFYRASFPRLSIDSQAGDPVAQQLVWFARHPAYFVATTLVGNNVANYLTTFAIGWGVPLLFEHRAGSEILATLAMSPVIFVLGELVPKNLYYRAPIMMLRKDAAAFRLFYWSFLPLTLPLVYLSTQFERISGTVKDRAEFILGRSRLVEVMRQGRSEGLLTEAQTRMAGGLLQTAAKQVQDVVIPASRVFAVSSTTERDGAVACARQYAVSAIAVHTPEDPHHWIGYYRLCDLLISPEPLSRLLRPLPPVAATETRLQALQRLREAGDHFGIVRDRQSVLGLVSERGLVEQLFRTPTVSPPGPAT